MNRFLCLVFPMFLWSCDLFAPADDHFRAGKEAELKGDLVKAINRYTLAIDSGDLSKANLVEAYNARGIVYARKVRTEEAIADFDTAIRLSPLDAQGYYNRGLVGGRAKAIADLDMAIRLKPDYADALVARGVFHAEKGFYDFAIADFGKALAVKPDEPEILLLRGRSHRLSGQIEKAINDLTNSIRLNPKSADAYRARGSAYRQSGQYERALTDYNVAIDSDPKNHNGYFGRGLVRYFMGEFTPAAADFARALKSYDGHAYSVLWLFLAQSRLQKDGKIQLEEIAKQVDTMIWPGPIIDYYLDRMTHEEILKWASDGDPKKDKEKHCEAYFYLGQKALLSGKQAEAVRFFKGAIETGVVGFVEYTGAETELRRLKP